MKTTYDKAIKLHNQILYKLKNETQRISYQDILIGRLYKLRHLTNQLAFQIKEPTL